MTDLQDLSLHPFAQDALENGVSVQKMLGDRSPSSVVPDYAREPDEHEFFLIRVATSLVEVLNCCHQLSEIPLFLGNHRSTKAMDKAGVNRHSLIVYHIENYLVRTQTLLDRVLKLVDAVFHLLNASRNCRYDVVMKNVKVQVSSVPNPLTQLKNLLNRYTGVRNEIIHQHSIKEDPLRRLALYFLLQRWDRISPREGHANVDELIKESVFEILWFKKKELLAFNKEVALSVSAIFDSLAPYYAREEAALRLRLSKPRV
jgi:hypothetical protein